MKTLFYLMLISALSFGQNRIYSLTEETTPDSTSYLLLDRSSYALPKKVKVANLLNIEALQRAEKDDTIIVATGLDADGSYTANENTNFLKAADFAAAGAVPSLMIADSILDAKIDTMAGMWIKGTGDEAILMENTKEPNIANGSNSLAVGHGCTSLGSYSVAAGLNSVAAGNTSIALGSYAGAGYRYSFAFGGQTPDSVGACQTILSHGWAETTDATATTIYIDATPSYKWVLKTDQLANFEINVIAVQTGGAGGTVGDAFTQTIRGGIKNLAGTTSLIGAVNSETAIKDAAFGGTVAVTADDTNDMLKVAVTGEASKNIRWIVELKAVVTGFRNFSLLY